MINRQRRRQRLYDRLVAMEEIRSTDSPLKFSLERDQARLICRIHLEARRLVTLNKIGFPRLFIEERRPKRNVAIHPIRQSPRVRMHRRIRR